MQTTAPIEIKPPSPHLADDNIESLAASAPSALETVNTDSNDKEKKQSGKEKLRHDKRGTMELYQGLGMGVTRMLSNATMVDKRKRSEPNLEAPKIAQVNVTASADTVPTSPKIRGQLSPKSVPTFVVDSPRASAPTTTPSDVKFAQTNDEEYTEELPFERARSNSIDTGSIGRSVSKKKKHRLSISLRDKFSSSNQGEFEEDASGALKLPKNKNNAQSAPTSPLSPRTWLKRSGSMSSDDTNIAQITISPATSPEAESDSKRSPRQRSRTMAPKGDKQRPSAKEVLGSPPPVRPGKDRINPSGSVIVRGARGDVGGQDTNTRSSPGTTSRHKAGLLSKGSLIWGRSKGEQGDRVSKKNKGSRHGVKDVFLDNGNSFEWPDRAANTNDMDAMRKATRTLSPEQEEQRQLKMELLRKRRSRSYSDLTVLFNKNEIKMDAIPEDLGSQEQKTATTESTADQSSTDDDLVPSRGSGRRPGHRKISGTEIGHEVPVMISNSKMRRSNSFADMKLIFSLEERMAMGIVQAKPTIKPGNLFGVTLEDLLELQDPKDDVPYIIVALTEAILALGGPMTEGLFRISGNKVAMDEMKEQLNSGNYDIPSGTNPHTVASLLKELLSSLKEPIIPRAFYQRCLDSVVRPRDCLLIIEQMPPLHLKALKYMVTWLQENILKPDVQRITRMDISSVSMAFSPCFMFNPAGAAMDDDAPADPLEGTTPPKARSEKQKQDLQTYVKNMQLQIKFVVNVLMLLNTDREMPSPHPSPAASTMTPRLVHAAGPAAVRIAAETSRRRSGHFHAWFKRGHDDDRKIKSAADITTSAEPTEAGATFTDLPFVPAQGEKTGGESTGPTRELLVGSSESTSSRVRKRLSLSRGSSNGGSGEAITAGQVESGAESLLNPGGPHGHERRKSRDDTATSNRDSGNLTVLEGDTDSPSKSIDKRKRGGSRILGSRGSKEAKEKLPKKKDDAGSSEDLGKLKKTKKKDKM